MRRSSFSFLNGTLAAAFTAFGLVSVLPGEASAEPSKIAIVDVQRAVLETTQGVQAQATLKKLFSSRQAELEAKQKQLQTDKEAFDRLQKAGKAPPQQLQQKAEDLQKKYAEYQATTLEYQREMQRKEGELTQPVLQGVLAVVRRIAAQEGYEMVLEKSAVPYFRTDLDVTDKAIQMFNQSGPPAKGAPAAPPPPKKK